MTMRRVLCVCLWIAATHPAKAQDSAPTAAADPNRTALPVTPTAAKNPNAAPKEPKPAPHAAEKKSTKPVLSPEDEAIIRDFELFTWFDLLKNFELFAD